MKQKNLDGGADKEFAKGVFKEDSQSPPHPVNSVEERVKQLDQIAPGPPVSDNQPPDEGTKSFPLVNGDINE
jgi:hypothetical protein